MNAAAPSSAEIAPLAPGFAERAVLQLDDRAVADPQRPARPGVVARERCCLIQAHPPLKASPPPSSSSPQWLFRTSQLVIQRSRRELEQAGAPVTVRVAKHYVEQSKLRVRSHRNERAPEVAAGQRSFRRWRMRSRMVTMPSMNSVPLRAMAESSRSSSPVAAVAAVEKVVVVVVVAVVVVVVVAVPISESSPRSIIPRASPS